MKKLLSLILAAAAALTMSSAVFADAAPKKDAATLSFDTDVCLSYVHTFGNASDTNLSCSLGDRGAISGRCLVLNEDFSGDVSNMYGGIYFEASDFGLESFSGYTMTVNYKPTAACAKATELLMVFSDGAQWVTQNVNTSNTNGWTPATISVPASVQNTKLGISIPITSSFSGDVVYIDDVTITDNYGNTIANIGDLDTSLAEAPSTLSSVLTTILFILLILVVIAGVVFVIMKVTRRYR